MRRIVMSVLGSVLLTALAAAQPSTSAPAAPPSSGSPLKGPKVNDGSVPGENRSFGSGKAGKERAREAIPHRAFLDALDVLRGKDAGADALTEAQEARIDEIERDFGRSIQEYRKAHLGEGRELMAQLSPEDRRKAEAFLSRRGEGPGPKDVGKNGKAPPAERDSMMQAAPDAVTQAAAKEKLRALLENAPKPADAHTRIYAELTPAQRTRLNTRLDAIRKEQTARREPDRAKARVQKKRPEATPSEKSANPK